MFIPDYRANERIRVETVRLVDLDGRQVGIVSLAKALQEARDRELDLVEVAPEAEPPVCKLLDYGKFKYRQKKKRQGQKHHRAQSKEIRIGLNSEEHDLAFKAARVREFIAEHDKVMVSMRLKGRQKAHIDLALEHMADFAGRFEDVVQIESGPERAGASRMAMLLKPK